MPNKKVIVIGAGLAGCEAAHRLASRGIPVELYEMRPTRQTEAHQTDMFAELVCSNSFKSLSPVTAPGILKREMEMLGSLAIEAAKHASIAAGEALAVDRDVFAKYISEKIHNHPLITVKREEITSFPDDETQLCILATGPLTSSALSESLEKRIGTGHFYFYDAISPIVDRSSIDDSIIFAANRYGKITRAMEDSATATAAAEESNQDYLNCPLGKDEYYAFVDLLLAGERVTPKSFERVKHFEGCMPIEEMADRGRDTLRFGPMKPVGIIDPRTGREPYACVQFRAENASQTAYNIVGFQTKLKYGEQARIFRTLPGLATAEFLRMGSMHRNTFVDAPRVLNLDLSLKNARHVLLAGQITGVEGYMESATIGILAAIFAEAKLGQKPVPNPPAGTAMGSLLGHVRNVQNQNYQPSGIQFGMFEDHAFADALGALKQRFPKKLPKDEKRKALSEASLLGCRDYAARLSAN